MRGKRLDVQPGDRFGRYVVVQELAKRNGSRYFLCRCDCGTTKAVRLDSLRSGAIQSCGCYNREVSRRVNSKHGMYRSRLYRIWLGMKRRCFNPHYSEYPNYGGRGITICQEWLDFSAFYQWAIHSGYRDDLTIERIDVNGNYEPANCTWVPAEDQRRNTTRVQRVTLHGQSKTLRQWAKEAGMHFSTLMNRLRSGMTLEQALSMPVRRKAVNR